MAKWRQLTVNLLYEVSKANGDLFSSPKEWRDYLYRMGISEEQAVDLQRHGEWMEPAFYGEKNYEKEGFV